tara:strand:- start:458 stop:601 length:144 start_codon:yes stop_codon:yes gene_type:complete
VAQRATLLEKRAVEAEKKFKEKEHQRILEAQKKEQMAALKKQFHEQE